MSMLIYYDSKTGNVERFINKLKRQDPTLHFIKISSTMTAKEQGHLITFTTKIGEVPESTRSFLLHASNYNNILSVSSSGNINWGIYYAVAADLIAEEFNIKLGIKFELSGTQQDVLKYLKTIGEL